MKFDPSDHGHPHPDAIDLQILERLQENCKQPLAAIGEKVGLKAPSVMERIHKLEQAGIIQSYTAVLDARALGRDVSAFIGVSIDHPRALATFESEVARLDDVLDCHHVTGNHTLMLKVKTQNTESLERLIEQMRCVEGVTRTETMVVLSTRTERTRLGLENLETPPENAPRPRNRREGKRRSADSA